MTLFSSDPNLSQAVDLLNHYSFDLAGAAAERWVAAWSQWGQDPSWIREAIIEALYQGRYKAVSVGQVLQLWVRRGQPLHHFGADFDRMVCSPLQLISEPNPEPWTGDTAAADPAVSDPGAMSANGPRQFRVADSAQEPMLPFTLTRKQRGQLKTAAPRRALNSASAQQRLHAAIAKAEAVKAAGLTGDSEVVIDETHEATDLEILDLESSDLASLDSASLDPEPLVNESSVPEPLPIPAAPPAAPQNRADQVSAAAESDVPAEAAEPDELDSALDALEEMLDESAPPVPAKASSTDPVRIPVSGLSRPIKSGLPKALIAKLAALLDSAPPEAVVHRQSDPSQRSAPPIPTTPDLKSAKTPRSKTVRVGLDRIKRINTLFGELVTYENKGSLQAQQLQHVIGSMTQRFRNFERITRSLQDWADQSQQDRSRLMASAANDGGFDALQMDSYDDVHLLMQEVMEEIAQLGEAIHDMTAINQQGQQVNRQKQQTLRQIRNDLIRTSMMPMGDLLRHFPRMVRDMSTKFNKTVKMVVDGGDTLVDRTVFEKLYDPLVHLVRNAFDHGIETPGMRVRLNKPAEATISLRAYSKSHQTYLEISDDGRGISLDRVRQKAIEQGLYSTEEAAKLSSDQLYDCLFHPGFSTASAVSELSGRGVGLDVVATQLKQLKGAIKVISVPNRGTTFVLRFPLSLNVAELMVFSVGSRTFAIAMDTVKTILSVATEDITIGDETPFYRWQRQTNPL